MRVPVYSAAEKAACKHHMMKKILKSIAAILSTAWYAALTFFCITVFGTALFRFADKFLNNNIGLCMLLGAILIGATMFVGDYVKKKANRKR